MAALGAVAPSRFVADLKAGVTELRRRVPGKKVAAIGFCFGGGMTWLLLASKEPRLSAAVPFYGPFPDGGSLAGSNAAVLGVYAELDARVNASRSAARAALRKAGLKHAIATFPGVDHAFFNPTSARHDPAAAAAAYRRMLSWCRGTPCAPRSASANDRRSGGRAVDLTAAPVRPLVPVVGEPGHAGHERRRRPTPSARHRRKPHARRPAAAGARLVFRRSSAETQKPSREHAVDVLLLPPGGGIRVRPRTSRMRGDPPPEEKPAGAA